MKIIYFCIVNKGNFKTKIILFQNKLDFLKKNLFYKGSKGNLYL